jgi:hypothetical protein
MTPTPAETARLHNMLAKLVPLFREAAFFIGCKRQLYKSPAAALLIVAESHGFARGHALDAFNAFASATSDVWNGWPRSRVADVLRDAADSFEAQLEAGL